jgi:heme/copper-type cytochrome/quinol oxidase subunit 2
MLIVHSTACLYNGRWNNEQISLFSFDLWNNKFDLTILVNDGILYVTIDAIVSFWSYVFFVFNPFSILYKLSLVLQHGPSVWINSTTMIVVLFVYPIIVVAMGLVLFFKCGGFIRSRG